MQFHMPFKNSHVLIATLLAASLMLGGCEAIRTSMVSPEDRADIRTAALRFTNAAQRDDATEIRDLTLVSDNPQSSQIEAAVLTDTLTSRAVQSTLTEKFGYREKNPAVIGGTAWFDHYAAVAQSSPIQRVGDRAHIGSAGKEGGFFLRNVDGAWKVELIATFVSEARGRPEVSDPAVLYRFGVNQAVDQWLLTRLANDEFPSVGDYDQASQFFWITYLGCTLSGKDPHNELLASLPPLPRDNTLAVDQ